jgi:hypothetical protein
LFRRVRGWLLGRLHYEPDEKRTPLLLSER